MKTAPIVAAEVDFDTDPSTPRAPAFDDAYHPRGGGFEQARHVFLDGNGLPARWRGRARLCVGETGFGLGTNFLATWAAWRDDPARCGHLTFVAVEKHPLSRADLERAHAASPCRALARQLIDAWPPLVPNLHALDFEDGRVRLLLGFGDALPLLRHLVARIDAFFLDGFAPARNAEMWSPELFKALARLAAPDATAATWSAARVVRDGLASAGFEVRAAPGQGGKRDITLARFAPRFAPPAPPGRGLPGAAPSHALVIGAGLAGAATARALARQGVACTVIDAAGRAATQASGNPAGLLHGAVAVDDGPHARLHRAAALHAARAMRGALGGLLRLETTRDFAAMQRLVAAQRLPADCVEALDARAASARAGVALAAPAWWFVQGGAADPAALARDWVPGPIVRAQVQRLARAGLPQGGMHARRGQLSWAAAADVRLRPRCPIAGNGYALALADGGLLFGATSQAADDDANVRAADHAENLARARVLLGGEPLREGALLHGRVGWRASTVDRLPLAGLVPDLQAPRPARRDAPRLLRRAPGLSMLTGLGSRGLALAPLCAELVAAQLVGAPWPLEADLVDAIDPARLALRQS
ncbi:MAG TPA: tRNA (5-methylaminomethyl-2-thiouridine)(34)-methyltransferase MnmD [Burkholderiaceae bacterium]|nr:tRNA (5-methylaminomethyl-2-thiouridine)(34)-methyltransferase MnmD [Burkholderiaceae bacterium]